MKFSHCAWTQKTLLMWCVLTWTFKVFPLFWMRILHLYDSPEVWVATSIVPAADRITVWYTYSLPLCRSPWPWIPAKMFKKAFQKSVLSFLMGKLTYPRGRILVMLRLVSWLLLWLVAIGGLRSMRQTARRMHDVFLIYSRYRARFLYSENRLEQIVSQNINCMSTNVTLNRTQCENFMIFNN